ncbi:hypothetical protein, partial [Bradyrhizobium sp. 33ap4]|uniref:hypothetical protein n=1 Tax=Bradyrhizobium sp. 33ap4 TaxID=3061630 RepID=UPI002930FF82
GVNEGAHHDVCFGADFAMCASRFPLWALRGASIGGDFKCRRRLRTQTQYDGVFFGGKLQM